MARFRSATLVFIDSAVMAVRLRDKVNKEREGLP
jgi:hypothetical protein